MKYGPYTQVVFPGKFDNIESILIETCKMWSLQAGGLCIQVVLEQVRLYI